MCTPCGTWDTPALCTLSVHICKLCTLLYCDYDSILNCTCAAIRKAHSRERNPVQCVGVPNRGTLQSSLRRGFSYTPLLRAVMTSQVEASRVEWPTTRHQVKTECISSHHLTIKQIHGISTVVPARPTTFRV